MAPTSPSFDFRSFAAIANPRRWASPRLSATRKAVQKFVSDAISIPPQAQTTGKLRNQLAEASQLLSTVLCKLVLLPVKTRSTLSQLKQKYQDAVTSFVLDVSESGLYAHPKQYPAASLGSAISLCCQQPDRFLTIIDSCNRQDLATRNNPNKSAYAKVLDAASQEIKSSLLSISLQSDSSAIGFNA